MANMSVWEIQENKPHKLKESSLPSEKLLETWIEKDPSLVQSGLVIICRQLVLDGGRLDLLALDPLGRLVVIEIKPDYLKRDVIAQILFYVAQIEQMTYVDLAKEVNSYLAQRGTTLPELLSKRGIDYNSQTGKKEILAIVVGTGYSHGFETFQAYLQEKHDIPLTSIKLEVFDSANGKKVLVRERTDADGLEIRAEKEVKKGNTVDDILLKAESYGTREKIPPFLELAEQHNFYTRPYVNSIMFTPQQNKARMLFTLWIKPNKNGLLKTYVGSDVFSEYYPIASKDSLDILGEEGWRLMNSEDIERFIESINALFKKINNNEGKNG